MLYYQLVDIIKLLLYSDSNDKYSTRIISLYVLEFWFTRPASSRNKDMFFDYQLLACFLGNNINEASRELYPSYIPLIIQRNSIFS
jgi:hypothetical protein